MSNPSAHCTPQTGWLKRHAWGCVPVHAALAVIRHFAQDGYNQLGDLTPDGGLINGIFYSRWNYSVRCPLETILPKPL